MKNLQRLIASLLLFGTLSLTSCNGFNAVNNGGNNQTSTPSVVQPSSNANPSESQGQSETSDPLENDERYYMYKKALEAGYEGTYEEWLAQISGNEIILTVINNDCYILFG